jgi:CDP-glucose 4,6-dehydratase
LDWRFGALEKVVMAAARNLWSGRRVFITGHTGFKGSWLSLWLQKLGADVRGYALAPSTTPSMFDIAGVTRGMRSVIGDVRDLGRLTKEIAEFKPEVVFHLAAQSLVRPSYEDPVGTYATNVMGTVHVLEAIRSTPGVRAAVVVTSDKCYENNEWAWGYRESDPMGGFDPYSNSKGCAELVTSAYRRSFFTSTSHSQGVPAVASGRAGNVIGGGDWAHDRLVPDFIRAMSGSEAICLRNPGAQRPWQHVLEPLSGYLLLAERLMSENGQTYGSGWNFGPRDDDAIPVASLVEKLAKLWGDGATYTIDKNPQPHEATFLKLDCSRARASLGWQPRLSVDLALAWTVEWHKAHLQGKDMLAMTISQIERFSSAA